MIRNRYRDKLVKQCMNATRKVKPMSLLEKYTEQAKHMTNLELTFAIGDIKNCWKNNPEWEETDHPYGAKLWAEWDAYTVELQNRGK